MKQPDSPKNLEKKLSDEFRNLYFRDIKKIMDTEYVTIKLRRELYKKIWPLDYEAIPKKLLSRYKVVLEKLGSLNRSSLKKFIFDSFYTVKEVKEGIKNYEAIADTLEYFAKEKNFKSYKERNEIYSVVTFADYHSIKFIVELWQLLESPSGYNQLKEEDIKSIGRYYNKALKNK
jgi:hypothetical protein